MGTSKSKPSEKGQLFIQAQKEMYYQNETIQGQVCLNVKQVGFPAGILQLRFVGKDFAKVVEQTGSGKNRRTIRMVVNQKFVNFKTVLHDFGKELPVTQVVFPFQVSLNLQTSTFNYYFCPNKWAYIKFYLVAQIINNPINKLDEVIKFKLPLIIVSRYSPLIRPIQINKREEIVYCCCCKNGYAVYDYDLPKTDFKFGETFNMTLNVDLAFCQKEILFIKMYIYGKCLVDFSSKREFLMVYHTVQYDGCAAGQSKKYNISLTLNKEKSGGDIVLQSTTVSPKIKYNYFVSFYYKYKGCDCCLKCEQEIPITIVRPPKQAYKNIVSNTDLYKPPIASPQIKDWKPKVKKDTKLIVHQEQLHDKELIIHQANQSNKVVPAENDYNNYHAFNSYYQPVPSTQLIEPQQHNPIQNHKIQDNPFG